MGATYSIPLKQGATNQLDFQLLQSNGTPVPGIAAYDGTHVLQVRTAPISQGGGSGTPITTATLTVTDAANAKIRAVFSVAQSRLITNPRWVWAAELRKANGESWVAVQGDFARLVLEITL